MKDFRQHSVWEKSHVLTLKIYGITTHFPKEELYGLTSQIRRSSASIPTNIAEGCGRNSDTEFRRFLVIAMGSASELEYLLQLASDLDYMNRKDYKESKINVIEVKRMLSSLIQKLKADRRKLFL